MNELDDAKRLLDEINALVSGYDPVLREKARDILLAKAFGTQLNVTTVEGANAQSTDAPISEVGRITGLKSLIDRWPPKTVAERALLSAYHLQHILGYRGLTGKQIQNHLKRHGARLANITVSIGENIKATPARMSKTKIPGKMKNEYIVTQAGIRYVQNKLDGVDGT